MRYPLLLLLLLLLGSRSYCPLQPMRWLGTGKQHLQAHTGKKWQDQDFKTDIISTGFITMTNFTEEHFHAVKHFAKISNAKE